MLVDGRSESMGDPFHSREIIDARPRDRLQPAELSQEFPTPLGAQARDLLQRRGKLLFLTATSMRSDSKSMSFVANLLNQM